MTADVLFDLLFGIFSLIVIVTVLVFVLRKLISTDGWCSRLLQYPGLQFHTRSVETFLGPDYCPDRSLGRRQRWLWMLRTDGRHEESEMMALVAVAQEPASAVMKHGFERTWDAKDTRAGA